jgi:predicted dehydrogenase
MDSASRTGALRIGIVGAGGVVETLHLPVLQTLLDVRIDWICDSSESRAKALATRFKIPHAATSVTECAPVQAVLVAIPVGYRQQVLEYALAQGWHALCEKPFAASLRQHDALQAAAETRGSQLGVGLMRRFYRTTRLARDLVSSQVFGPLREVFAGEGGPLRGTGREGSWYQANAAAAGGGVLIETGSHVLDQVFWILNAERFELRQYSELSVAHVEYDAKVDLDVWTSRSSPIPVNIALSRVQDVPNGIWLKFDHATVHVPCTPDGPVAVVDSKGHHVATLQGGDGAQSAYQAFYLEWRAFLDQCVHGTKTDVSIDLARLGTAVVETCYHTRSTNGARGAAS